MSEEHDHKDPSTTEESPDGWNRTLTQMWALYLQPEIDRRRASGSLPEHFFVYIAQVLFSPDERIRVLLNDEVQGEGLMRAPRNIQKGEPLQSTDLQYMELFELPDELLDNGHFTIIRAGDGWRMFFNFLSGRAKAKNMLELAEQFLESARSSANNGHAGPAVENLFTACELASKAELILYRNPAVKAKTHGPVASEINKWARLGNIEAAFVALFNKLSQQRPFARYGNKDDRPPIPDQDSFDVVLAAIERGRERVSKATDRPIDSPEV
jgi:hypothetical protein